MKITLTSSTSILSWYLLLLITSCVSAFSQKDSASTGQGSIDVSGFFDSSHHWYDIKDQEKIIVPIPGQKRFKAMEVSNIADNILLYQKSNGGWPKNYDMLAQLTDDQKKVVLAAKNDTIETTFDNGTTHSQVKFLARAYSSTHDVRYKEACLRGIDFMLSAQYANGGWPQFYPDTSGYRKYITFNDDAMIGVMEVLYGIVQHDPEYSFVDDMRRTKARTAFDKGIGCILKCQVVENGVLKVWGQQHDNLDFRPRDARNFEPACLCSLESADLVLFLMSIDHPSRDVVRSVNNAVRWFNAVKIFGLRIDVIKAPTTEFKYLTSSIDRIVVNDSLAQPIWTRYYELGTGRPMFCNRDKKVVYSLAEVERERRVGYRWYGYDPNKVFKKYSEWQKSWSPEENALTQ